MFVDEELNVLRIDTETIKVRLISEPYVVFNSYGYQPAIDVWHIKKKRKFRLFLSARTLSTELEKIRGSNNLNDFNGIEFWINKASDDRKAAYVLNE